MCFILTNPNHNGLIFYWEISIATPASSKNCMKLPTKCFECFHKKILNIFEHSELFNLFKNVLQMYVNNHTRGERKIKGLGKYKQDHRPICLREGRGG